MEFVTVSNPSIVRKELVETVVLLAGESVKVELGSEEGSTIVPAGKTWEVRAHISVTETDV